MHKYKIKDIVTYQGNSFMITHLLEKVSNNVRYEITQFDQVSNVAGGKSHIVYENEITLVNGSKGY